MARQHELCERHCSARGPAADLVIIGRARDPADKFYSVDPGSVILRAGRPVLFVPDELAAVAARRIVVAWKDVREARRAVCDALPFLQNADKVMIVTVCDDGTEKQAKKSTDDLASYLRRHKIEVGIRRVPPHHAVDCRRVVAVRT